MIKYFLIALLICSSLFAQNKKWGWDAHGYINEHALNYLPAEMAFFQNHSDFLRLHSTDPDRDNRPGYYHYIDIDYYPEFFTGTLPHNQDSLVALYNLSIVQNNGTIPWVIEEWTDSLSTLMASGQWDQVWQVAAELGHYVADSHQPLHLALNYNGQLTGNQGIHSRYESSMINPHLPDLPLATGAARYWPNLNDSVFAYIDETYPYVDSIMIADDLASAQDPAYGAVYYDILWQELETLTTLSVHRAIIDLASIWQTAWENAGSPSPLTIPDNEHHPQDYYLADAYPNPFNPMTVIGYQLAQPSDVELRVYNLLGQKVATLVDKTQSAGYHQVQWQAGDMPSGVYYYLIHTAEFQDIKKVVLLR